ncbi:hypothetical protein M076_4789 [Bacteroides fragilis str. 2-F-2 |uniref:Uncharacterized protein n=1 Tax=Bacteroides fragilis str. 2-F-2 \|nr:hypothetical protein M077_4749 [Bacteroides fragilis str. 2-F-2 \
MIYLNATAPPSTRHLNRETENQTPEVLFQKSAIKQKEEKNLN